jgi:hypothetical protein
MMNFLSSLTPDSIKNGVFPLKDILKESLYYPYSSFNGEVIKNCNLHRKELDIISFVYCDSRQSLEALNNVMHLFASYNILEYRDLAIEELVPDGSMLVASLGLNINNYAIPQTPARWIVYERKPQKDNFYGPERFSLLYIFTKETATYRAIYQNNKLFPKVIASVESNNTMHTNLLAIPRNNSLLERTVERNPYVKPSFIMKYSFNYPTPDWVNYTIFDSSYISLWKRNDV